MMALSQALSNVGAMPGDSSEREWMADLSAAGELIAAARADRDLARAAERVTRRDRALLERLAAQ